MLRELQSQPRAFPSPRYGSGKRTAYHCLRQRIFLLQIEIGKIDIAVKPFGREFHTRFPLLGLNWIRQINFQSLVLASEAAA